MYIEMSEIKSLYKAKNGVPWHDMMVNLLRRAVVDPT
jgi:hypothetical protein